MTTRFEVRKVAKGWQIWSIPTGMRVSITDYPLKRDAMPVLKRLEAVETPRLDNDWDSYLAARTQKTVGPYAYELRQAISEELRALHKALLGATEAFL